MKDGLTQVKELKDKIHEQHMEIEKLNNIIEEIREYIESKKYWFCDDYDLREEDGKNILEILDKENI